MTIKERLLEDIKNAMRAKESQKLMVLRLITAAIKQIEVDERKAVETDEEILVILDKLIKQRKESILQFQAAARNDLVTKEQHEIELISYYLPEPLSEQEINDLIREAMAESEAKKMSDMGKVMAKLKPLIQGRADMTKVSMMVKSLLSANEIS